MFHLIVRPACSFSQSETTVRVRNLHFIAMKKNLEISLYSDEGKRGISLYGGEGKSGICTLYLVKENEEFALYSDGGK